ncbi:MAG: hypothetical protein N2Z21_10375 [Candidatus Sumerlaeaceae bacterium]|nr:hypothetical protein [Candidatus Sumerlaeaceae bacterium]
MKADIHTLLELQGVKKEQQQLREQSLACSRRLHEISTLVSQTRQQLQNLEEKHEAIKKQIRDGELELMTLEEKLKRAKNRLSIARTPKECEAAEHEIHTLQQKRESLDEQLLRLMDEQDQIERELKKRRDEWTLSAAEWEQERKRLEHVRHEAEKLEQALKADEYRLAQQLPEEIGEIFRRLLEKHPLPVVVRVCDRACGGCGTLLPLHFVQELKEKADVELCPHCRRLVFFDKSRET